MRRLPRWAWLLVLAGLLTMVAGAFLRSGSYLQSVAIQLGSTALLLVPIILVERNIASALEDKVEEVVAVQRAEQLEQMDEMWRDLGQALDANRLPDVTPAHLIRMLMADGWTVRETRNHQMVEKGGRRIAIPAGDSPVRRAIVRSLVRTAGWPRERFDQLFQDANE